MKFALNINDKRYIDYSKSNSFSLEKELTLINQSKLYIGSCTGLDVIALTNEIDTLLEQYGFERVETYWTDVKWGDALYLKIK